MVLNICLSICRHFLYSYYSDLSWEKRYRPWLWITYKSIYWMSSDSLQWSFASVVDLQLLNALLLKSCSNVERNKPVEQKPTESTSSTTSLQLSWEQFGFISFLALSRNVNDKRRNWRQWLVLTTPVTQFSFDSTDMHTARRRQRSSIQSHEN